MFDALRSIRDAVLLIDSDSTLLFSNTEAQEVLGLPTGGAGEGKSLRLLVGAEHPLMQLIGPGSAGGWHGGGCDVAFEIWRSLRIADAFWSRFWRWVRAGKALGCW